MAGPGLLALACALLACTAASAAAIQPRSNMRGQQQETEQQTTSLGYPGYPGGGGGGGDYPPYPSYPGAPGSGPSPPSGKDPLPFQSGMTVNLRSHVLGTYCNVGSGDEDPPYTFRCDEKDESVVWQGMLLIGQDYATNVIYDGSKITLKSQRENKVCGVGAAEDRYPVTCDQPFTGCATTFQIHRAKARDDLYYITPDNMPDHKCYPAHAAHDHGLEDVSAPDESSRDKKRPRHWLRCDRDHRGDNYLMEITQSSYWSPATVAAVPAEDTEGSVIKVGFPYWPGGPPAPGAPSAPDPDDDDVLPFTTGSTIQISDPDNEPLVCDTKDGGYGADWAWTRLGRKKDRHHDDDDDDDDKKTKKEKEKEDEKRVKCDRKGPEGPGSQWIPSGFLVLADDPSVRELKSGAAIYLSNQQTHKFCRPADDKDLLDGVFCDAEKGAGTKFQVFLAHHKKHHHHHHSSFYQTDDSDDEQDTQSTSLSISSAFTWLMDTLLGDRYTDKALASSDMGGDSPYGPPGGDTPYGPPGGDGDGSKTVAVYLLHVDSNRYCGADLKSKNSILVCDYKHKRRPKLHIKVNQGYPGGGGGASY